MEQCEVLFRPRGENAPFERCGTFLERLQVVNLGIPRWDGARVCGAHKSDIMGYEMFRRAIPEKGGVSVLNVEMKRVEQDGLLDMQEVQFKGLIRGYFPNARKVEVEIHEAPCVMSSRVKMYPESEELVYSAVENPNLHLDCSAVMSSIEIGC